jgi:trehalose 6-phosphate phosphatase
VSASPAETLAEALRPLTEAPDRTGLFIDVDGTLAPIVERAEDAHVPERTSRVLAGLGRRYACVACISGRAAAEARRLVGVGGIAYAGSHGAELIAPGGKSAAVLPAFDGWAERVKAFAAERDERDLRLLRVRIEDKGPIVGLHWRGAPDEDAARERLEQVAREAEQAGLATHWGRKVLEIRPPVAFDKGQALTELVRRFGVARALYAGDDVTDLDAYAALDALAATGELEAAVRVGIASDEGPAAIVERADVVVEGSAGFAHVLDALAEA